MRLTGENRQRSIVTHRAYRFIARLCHRLQYYVNIFSGITEYTLLFQQISTANSRIYRIKQTMQHDPVLLYPTAIWLGTGNSCLDFPVCTDTVIFHIKIDHLSRPQTSFADNIRLRQIQYTAF